MKVNIKTKGFTLTELLVALGVVGVLAAILMPVVRNIMPNQDALMVKKAYYTVQNVVSEMINDPNCYPDKTQAPGSEKRVGFDDGYGYPNCPWGRDVAVESIETEAFAGGKFKYLFSNKIGGYDDSLWVESWMSQTGGNFDFDFETADGMLWRFSGGGAISRNKGVINDICLAVDVNGTSKGNNCTSASSADASDCFADRIQVCGSGKTPDSMLMKIYTDGRIVVQDGWASELIKANSGINWN